MNATPGQAAYRIDTHHHMFPPAWLKSEDVREDFRVNGADYFTYLEKWTPAWSLETMDKGGIATAMLSLRSPGLWYGDNAKGRRLARECNDYGAGLVRDYPGSFGLLATLPLPDIEGALAEITYVFDTLKADGIGILSSYGDKWPGDPLFEPVLEELNRRKAAVFIHPWPPAVNRDLIKGPYPAFVTASAIEYLVDSTRAIVSLIFNGSLARFPHIRFIFGQGGGALPAIVSRIERVASQRNEVSVHYPKGVWAELAKLHYDCTMSANRTNLAPLLEFVPVSQILLGTDSPVAAAEVTLTGLANFGFSPADLLAVERDNALRLFPRLAKVATPA